MIGRGVHKYIIYSGPSLIQSEPLSGADPGILKGGGPEFSS